MHKTTTPIAWNGKREKAIAVATMKKWDSEFQSFDSLRLSWQIWSLFFMIILHSRTVLMWCYLWRRATTNENIKKDYANSEPTAADIEFERMCTRSHSTFHTNIRMHMQKTTNAHFCWFAFVVRFVWTTWNLHKQNASNAYGCFLFVCNSIKSTVALRKTTPNKWEQHKKGRHAKVKMSRGIVQRAENQTRSKYILANIRRLMPSIPI